MSENIFDLIDSIFNKANASYLVVGGFAVNAFGYMRATKDIDLIIDEGNYPALKQGFQKAGYKESYRGNVHARFSDHPEWPVDIDLLFTNTFTFQGLWKDAAERKMGERLLKVVSLNHLIAMKLHAIKNDHGDRKGRDLVDVKYLIQINRIDVASEDFRKLCFQYGTKEIYESIVRRPD